MNRRRPASKGGAHPSFIRRFPFAVCSQLSGVSIVVLTTFLLVVHSLLALGLVTVILMQKSEGGGLTGGGSSSGNLVSARGVGDLLTRATAILATLFIVSSLTLAWLAGQGRQTQAIDTSLARKPAAEAPASPGAAAAPVADALPIGESDGAADSVPLADVPLAD